MTGPRETFQSFAVTDTPVLVLEADPLRTSVTFRVRGDADIAVLVATRDDPDVGGFAVLPDETFQDTLAASSAWWAAIESGSGPSTLHIIVGYGR